ncbi:hypothetical protein [Actinomadura parmotrematis]|uniref:Uncharacterized protein n=1 Tax=Actinomadura parmotrematis TaxID=2864039 RepID=A0ABS7G2C0_9ACTN|nr:hypothetical protein [Actinomadura parmotrematis]MBW8486859.1 hypothetical protein [Actinomadura parmotrematis]
MTVHGPDPDERAPGRAYSARFHWLDRQVVADDGTPISKVDDLELDGRDGRLYATAVLVGPDALAPRLRGRLGRLVAAVARRLAAAEGGRPPRIDLADVAAVGAAVTLRPSTGDLRVHALEDWTRANVIERIPGARHASG